MREPGNGTDAPIQRTDASPASGCRAEEVANVLVVEDDPSYARLVEEALGLADTPTSLHIVTDGSAALDFIYQRGEYVDAPQPALVLLDWHLPRVDGSDVLAALRKDDDFQSLPVVILTHSSDQRVVRRAYQLGANAYVQKPEDLDDLLETVSSIAAFWL